MRGCLAAAVLALTIGWPAVAQNPTGESVHVAGGQRAPVLDDLVVPQGLSSVAVSPDGRSALLSGEDPGHAKRSLLWIYTDDESQPRTSRLPGLVRSALFSVEGNSVFLILYKPAKRRQGDAELVSVNIADAKSHGLQRLPSTATALDYWAAANSLVVATLNEIRTIRLDGMRSGPLFRIPGRNRAVASLAGSNLILVGQDDGLVLIHLDDPPDEESMPLRARIATPAPVVGLAAAPDGTEALARLSDGSLLRVNLDPLTTTPLGRAAAVVALRKDDNASRVPLDPRPAPPAESPDTAMVETAAVVAGTAAVASTPAAEPVTPGATASDQLSTAQYEPVRESPGEGSPPAPEGEQAPAAADEAGDLPEPAAASAVAAAAATEAPAGAAPSSATKRPAAPPEQPVTGTETASPPWPAGQPPQVWGRLTGAAAGQVESVVLYGPNNILREALRVVPAPNGVWSATGLEPGRYQVRLAATRDRVLVSEPPFASVDVATGTTKQLADLRVLRTYAP